MSELDQIELDIRREGRAWKAGEAALVSPNIFLMHDRFGWDAVVGASRQAEFLRQLHGP